MAGTEQKLRIAAFGFRSLPPSDGGAGADKFALELLPRIVERGHEVIAYNRIYPGKEAPRESSFEGVKIRSFRTVGASGFDTLLHSAKVTWDIIRHDRADVVHIQNGGNSPFALILRMFGKRTYLSQDGLDWTRNKWPWYGRLYLRMVVSLTGRVHNQVICDNIFVREFFEQKFGKPFAFIPFGADVDFKGGDSDILKKLNLDPGNYFLFVGRFIPDKGLQYLIPAFERLNTDKKLVLVGGCPNPSEFERRLKTTRDQRIVFPGFIYGDDTHCLMRNCYAYIQPSDVEGLSPVILESSFLGAPVISSDIKQNQYILGETGLYFNQGDIGDLVAVLEKALADSEWLEVRRREQNERITNKFSWKSVVDEHLKLFCNA